MRVFCLAGFMAVMAASAAQADVITQTLQMAQGGPDGGPFDITGAQFDPKLGTLESVTMTFSGKFQADIFVPDPAGLPGSVASHVVGSVDAGTGNGLTNGNFGPVTLSLSGNTYVGGALVSLTTPFVFAQPDAFLGTSPAARGLLDFGFFAPLGFPAGASSDASTFDGSLVLDYIYTPLAVPEAPAVLVFAPGILVLAGMVGFSRKPMARSAF